MSVPCVFNFSCFFSTSKYLIKIYQTVILLPLPNAWLFHWKTNLSIKWTVPVFSSIVELKLIKARVFLEGNNLHSVLRYERMKNWINFSRKMLYYYTVPFSFPSSIRFSINMERSKRTTTRIGHLPSSTKSKQKNPKKDST